MVGELSETTVEVICSPCPRIIDKIFQNPGDAGMYIITMADLGLTLQIAQQIGLSRSEERKTINILINILTFDVDDTDYHVPPVPRSDVSSEPLKIL